MKKTNRDIIICKNKETNEKVVIPFEDRFFKLKTLKSLFFCYEFIFRTENVYYSISNKKW